MHFAHVISGSRLSSMTTTTCERHASATPAARQHDQLAGVALMTGSALSVQLGAATAALAFPVLGPAGVVAIRQWVAGAVLLSSVRPKFRSFTRRQWRPVLALALIFAVMNLSLYVAIDTIGLGLAVTLEFLGPLAVALLASRRAVDLGCALAAAAAVVVLARPQPTTDYAGIGLALLAAACWAGYILVNRVVGERLPGSAVPMVIDLLALRRVPARFYGVFMSVNPVFAALVGLVVLGQSLQPVDWLAITAIVAANALALSTSGRDRATSDQPRRLKVPAPRP